jgi:hypothetical protein
LSKPFVCFFIFPNPKRDTDTVVVTPSCSCRNFFFPVDGTAEQRTIFWYAGCHDRVERGGQKKAVFIIMTKAMMLLCIGKK